MTGKNERRQTRRPATKFAHMQKKLQKQKSQTAQRNERKK